MTQKLLFAAALVAGFTTSVLAGPNAGGSLVVHTDPSVAYTTDTTNYCGLSGITDCSQVVSEITGNAPSVWWVLAAFDASLSPRVAGITFGLSYDSAQILLLGQGPCADFELATSNWPLPGEGTAVTWNSARTTSLIEVYWFAGYNYYGNPQQFCLAAHPTQGANFADDAVPANLDPIGALGCLGFNMVGSAPCLVVDQLGACCLPNGSCQITDRDSCAAQQGQYQGDGSGCDPNPCPPPPGACCLPTGACVIVSRDDCAGQGGTFIGEGTSCNPDPCGVEGACCRGTDCAVTTEAACNDGGGVYLGDGTECDPNPCSTGTESRTWGGVKRHYR